MWNKFGIEIFVVFVFKDLLVSYDYNSNDVDFVLRLIWNDENRLVIVIIYGL